MQTTRSNIRCLWIMFFILVPALVWMLSSGDVATAGTYADSAHGDSSSGVNRSGAECPIGTDCPRGDCANCHETFDPAVCGVNETMLFAGLDDPGFCMECHTNSGSAQDSMPTRPGKIKSVFDKTYKHDVKSYSGLHQFSPQDETQAYLSANPHVECNDCHSPHTIGGIDPAVPLVHPAGDTTPDRTSDSNLIYDATFGSGVLQGVWGVDASSWPGNWVRPTLFTELKPATYADGVEKEYQICFKCHSNYTDWGSGDAASSVARDFNPNNKSAHPVLVTQNNQTGSDWVPYQPWEEADKRKGLYAKAGDTLKNQLKDPWITNRSETTMYCSDCHGNDDEGSTYPVGVHGSGKASMLRSWHGSDRHYWPEKPGGGYWTLYDVKNNINVGGGTWEDYLFCGGCHVIKYGTFPNYGFKNNVHAFSSHIDYAGQHPACVYCHNRRVHGSDLGRLMGGIDYYGDTNIRVFVKKGTVTGGGSGYTNDDCKVSTYSPTGHCYGPGGSHDAP